MKNGCPDCEKLPDGELCLLCEIGWFESLAEVALKNYTEAVNKLLYPKKEKQK